MCPRLIGCVLATLLLGVSSTRYTEQELATYLAGDYETLVSELCHKSLTASFAYQTDLLNVSKKREVEVQEGKYSAFNKQQWLEYWRDADWRNFRDEFVQRQLKFLSRLGSAALEDASLNKLSEAQDAMMTTFSLAKICPYRHQHCDLDTEGMELNPDIEAVMAKSRDYDELAYTWLAWRDATGAKLKHNYKQYVKYSNMAAQANGFPDMGAMWRDTFETEDFVGELEKLWQQVEPLYVSLHAYVLDKLRMRYGDRMGGDRLIPAHLTGNMWAQTWINLYDLVLPYPEASTDDVTTALRRQNYSVLRMFETADDFYTSLGLVSNEVSYDEARGAMLTRPEGREAVCHASAWDLCDGKDFRIKMCAEVELEDFITIHHEMGHIQYYQQYKNLPHAFRQSCNPGFTEAVGDTIALSVSTPQHLHKIGLLANYTDSHQVALNALVKSALAKVAFLPFGLLVDKWRWDVFSGAVDESEWNAHWWRLRESLQRVAPPVGRSEKDFDPGAKYHVATNSQYISYFVSYILQFQLHKALCIAAGQYDPDDPQTQPFHKCDIFRSRRAGKLLAAGLSLGRSKHWREVLFVLTGERNVNASAILEYYAPLQEFLDKHNAATRRERMLGL